MVQASSKVTKGHAASTVPGNARIVSNINLEQSMNLSVVFI